MAKKPIRTIRRKVTGLAHASLCMVNRLLRRFDDKLLVIGEGRSGTTWLANILNFDDRYRMLFEPFQTENFRPSVPYQSEYPFPDSDGNDRVDRHIQKVIRGNYISAHANVQFSKALYHGLLIKDISAHLVIDELCASAPAMKTIMIVRHPFAVSASKAKVFDWPTDPSSFLSRDNCRRHEIEDVRETVELVSASNDPILKQVLLWCLSTRYAVSCRSIDSFILVFYEDLIARPEIELPRIFSGLGLQKRYFDNEKLIRQRVDRRSHVTFRNNAISGSKGRRTVWHDEWDTKTIDDSLRILEKFRFDRVYSDSFSPLVDISQFLSSTR